MVKAIYTPLLAALDGQTAYTVAPSSESMGFGAVQFEIRSHDDPRLALEELTEGTGDIGVDVSDERTVGSLVVTLGAIALLPCCFIMYLLKQSMSARGKQRVLMPLDAAPDLNLAGEEEADPEESPDQRRDGGSAYRASVGSSSRVGGSGGSRSFGGPSEGGKGRLAEMRRDGGANSEATGKRKGGGLPPKAMLSFAADLGIASADVTTYMWLCEEALAPSVLGVWTPHVDDQGAVFFFNDDDGQCRRLFVFYFVFVFVVVVVVVVVVVTIVVVVFVAVVVDDDDGGDVAVAVVECRKSCASCLSFCPRDPVLASVCCCFCAILSLSAVSNGGFGTISVGLLACCLAS
eukprot:SAG11_NODE_117_length_15962_cov_71.527925_9_plen_348_part_00